MINHFASLLYNKSASKIKGTIKNFSLAAGDSNSILQGSTDGIGLITSDFFTTTSIYSTLNQFIARDYIETPLPQELSDFYNLLFSSGNSEYYSKFVLYNYLKVLDATAFSDRVKDFDPRITYDLNTISEYFSVKRISESRATDPRFTLLISGDPIADYKANASLNDYIVMQQGNTVNIRVFSNTQKEYYAPNKPASKQAVGMSIPVQLDINNNKLSQEIDLPGTGLKISITGPMQSSLPEEWDPEKSYKYGDQVLYETKTYSSKTIHLNETPPNLDSANWLEYTPVDFLSTGNKVWVFSTNVPPKFNLLDKISEITSRDYVVQNMLEFSRDLCNVTYENIWDQHYNSIYRFAGLLLAYVERVNIVCQRKAM